MPDKANAEGLMQLREQVLALARDENDRLKPEEREQVRKLIALLPELEKVIERRKFWRTIWTALGEIVKWSGIVVGAVIAFKTLISTFWLGGK